METATAAQEAPLSIIISTQAPTDSDLLSILIDDAIAGHDPRTVVKLYTAPRELDPFAESTIRLANPALDAFMNRAEVLAMAADAKRMPARESEFRNLILNQRDAQSQITALRADVDGLADQVALLTAKLEAVHAAASRRHQQVRARTRSNSVAIVRTLGLMVGRLTRGIRFIGCGDMAPGAP